MSQATSETPDDVQSLLQPLEAIEDRPVGDHVAAFEEVHAGIRRVLAGESVSPQA
jgi:hypothetical protein